MAGQLKLKGGYSIKALWDANYDVPALKAAGATARDLRNEKIDDNKIKEGGYTAKEMKAAGYNAKKMRTLKYELADLLEAGYEISTLSGAGFKASEFKSAGTPVKDLFWTAELKENACQPKELLEAEFDRKEVVGQAKALGVGPRALRDAGVGITDLKALYAPAELRIAGYSVEEIKMEFELLEILRSFEQVDRDASEFIRGLDYNDLAVLRSEEVQANTLKKAGYSVEDMMDAGYTVAELREGGYSVEEIKNAGVDGENMLAGGFSVSDLKSGGFTAIDLKSAGVSGLLWANFKLQEVEYAFPGMVISAELLRASGWDVRRVHDEGFLPEELLHGGFTLRELYRAGLPKASKLYHEQSVSLELLRDAGLDPDDIDVRESLFGNYGFRKYIFPTSELLRVGVKRKNGGDITYVCEGDDSPKSEHYFGRFGGSEKCEFCGKKRLVRSLHTNPSVLFAAERLAHSVRRPVLPKIGKVALCTASPLPGAGRRGALHEGDTAGWSSRKDAWSGGPSCRLWYLPAPLKEDPQRTWVGDVGLGVGVWNYGTCHWMRWGGCFRRHAFARLEVETIANLRKLAA